MNTHTSDIDADHKRLDVARTLYKALVAQDPDRLITLCDGRGQVLARSERRPKEVLPRRPLSCERRHTHSAQRRGSRPTSRSCRSCCDECDTISAAGT